jgi:hypothetical protein
MECVRNLKGQISVLYKIIGIVDRDVEIELTSGVMGLLTGLFKKSEVV